MRQVILCSVALLSSQTALAAPIVSYEGPPELRKMAEAAYVQLAQDCPRIRDIGTDVQSYSLHVGTDKSRGIYGDGTRALGAKVTVVATIRFALDVTHIPEALIPSDGFTNFFMVAGTDFSGIILRDRAAYWLCQTDPDPGAPMAAKPSRGVGRTLLR